MITNFFRFICTTLLFLCIGSHAYALSLESIRFGEHPDKTRMVIDLNKQTAFKAFVLDTPYRLVIDLPKFSWQVSAITKPKSGAIKEIRHGPQGADKARLVVDIAHPIAIRSAFILPKAGGKPDRLVIDFEKVTQSAYTSRKDRTFGNLKVAQAPKRTDKIQNFVRQKNLNSKNEVASATNDSIVKPTTKPQPPKTIAARPASPVRKSIVVIDPGHGGQDPGAVGANGFREKDVTFLTAKELKKQLESTGLYKVYLTRTTDKYLKLHRRVAIARKKNADLFMSIHADSINKPNVRGASIYTLSDKASDAQTARLAARENQSDLIAGVDLSHEDKEVANILLDLSMRDTMNQSKFLANTLVDTMKARGMKMLTRPHRFAGFAVLKAPDVPSVLVEVGFISNAREAAMLKTSSHQRKIAASLVDGVNVYFSKIRKNNSSY